jgi:hypothetical protein
MISGHLRLFNDGHYTDFLNESPNFEHIAPPLTVDTINLITSYKIPTGDYFPLESKIAQEPDFKNYKEILILKPDSLLLQGAEEIENAFERLDEWHWVL